MSIRTLLLLSLILSAAGSPAAAQGRDCDRLSQQLLEQLDRVPPRTLEAEADRQRGILRTRGCDPQASGYNVGVESIKLNDELDFQPAKKKQPFRLDKLIQIQY